VFQTTLRNPQRLSKEGVPEEDGRTAYLSACDGLWGIAHASLLTNLASTDPRTRNASVSALAADANLAAQLGLHGANFHAGYQKGHATVRAALDEASRKLSEAIAKLKPGARALLENSCEGSELCQTVEEMAHTVRTVGAPPHQLGIVLDTCHLHVAGFDLSLPEAAERLANDLADADLADRLIALHLNDAQFPAGSKRDRHAVPGEGTIGEGLLRLLSHPLFAPLPCILEMDPDAALRGIAFMTHE
jgi:deoxyribonuclease-4